MGDGPADWLTPLELVRVPHDVRPDDLRPGRDLPEAQVWSRILAVTRVAAGRVSW